MCELISGYQLPNGSLHFHTDSDVEAAWERAGKTEPIAWKDMVGHSGYHFCFGEPPNGSKEVEGLRYLIGQDLRKFRKLIRGAGYQSMTLRSPAQVAKGLKLCEEGDKLSNEGDKLCEEGDRLYTKSCGLCNEGNKLWNEGNKIREEGGRIFNEGSKLCEEGHKLYDRGDKFCFTFIR